MKLFLFEVFQSLSCTVYDWEPFSGRDVMPCVWCEAAVMCVTQWKVFVLWVVAGRQLRFSRERFQLIWFKLKVLNHWSSVSLRLEKLAFAYSSANRASARKVTDIISNLLTFGCHDEKLEQEQLNQARNKSAKSPMTEDNRASLRPITVQTKIRKCH